ncbi:uncharacterized protein [Asterias amurensis]|uniref:uncharacterized protein n=1 Tax=Asterias amurensis TaxID=7602 RepID=UPI003AB47DA6
MSDNINRIFLWSVPRTVSTALVKCLSFVDGLQVVMEPYSSAFYAGPESKVKEQYVNSLAPTEREMFEKAWRNGEQDIHGYDESICTYGYVRDEILQVPYEDTKFLFCKDMAFHLVAKYHMLPMGFKYSFLIRHPAKVFVSWKKLLTKALGESFNQPGGDLLSLPSCMFPAGYGFKELYELTKYVEKELHQEPVILDIDDLLADPPRILSAYCHKIGIPYNPELLSWAEGSEVTNKWVISKALMHASNYAGPFGEALKSTGFHSPEPAPDLESLPADVEACVKASMEYYEKLYAKRIKPVTESVSQ